MMGYPHASFSALPQIFASLLLLAASSAFANAETPSNGLQTSPSSSIQITLSKQADTVVRLEARSAPLGQILKAIAGKTGAQIHYSVLPEAPVTATCVGANVGQVMDCLVAKKIGLVAHKAQKDKPAEFWLLDSGVGSCQAVAVAASPMPIQQVADQPPKADEQAEMERMMQEQSDQLLKKTVSKDATERASAIGNLGAVGAKDDPNVDTALRNALDDENADVRSQAMASIAQRGGRDVNDQISRALKDKANTVRIAAVSAITDDVTLLNEAVNDRDQSVRDIAKSKLENLQN